MESVQLKINEHMTSVGEDILCVLEKQQSVDVFYVKLFVLERLHVAAGFMFDLFQREMGILHKTLHTADFLSLPVCKEAVFPEHKEKSPSLVQEEPQPPHIKDVHEELLQRPQEAMMLLAVKREEDDENRETETVASTSTEHMKTQASVENCGTSQQTRDEQLLSPHGSEFDVTEDSDDWEETREGQSAVNTLDSHKTQNVEEQTLSSSHKLSQDLSSSTQTDSMESHTGTKGFSCTGCGNMFSHKFIHTVHTRETSFECNVCGQGFGLKSNVKSHMRTGEKLIECTVCGKGCNKCDMYKHMRTHTGEKPFACNVCNKCFSQSGDLKRHMRTHTGEKPFSCKVCGKRCTTNGDIKSHMRTHTGERPFGCKVCDKCFGQSGDLKIHMRTHTGEKPFSCKVCGKGYSRSGDLKTHMMTHTGEKPFACTVCGIGCCSMTQLKTHMRTHTG